MGLFSLSTFAYFVLVVIFFVEMLWLDKFFNILLFILMGEVLWMWWIFSPHKKCTPSPPKCIIFWPKYLIFSNFMAKGSSFNQYLYHCHLQCTRCHHCHNGSKPESQCHRQLSLSMLISSLVTNMNMNIITSHWWNIDVKMIYNWLESIHCQNYNCHLIELRSRKPSQFPRFNVPKLSEEILIYQTPRHLQNR